ncbi:unnamed protein product [Rotaria sordida]|uniref:Ion transport domain-containing protein n=1 Tax=Rotaria sordida TaxID=392033 RepID=A0A819TM83_9BILA|nr:unnamed protein product [Rotaria sordida]CAF4081672.1 unnamed protein product [Rotaria sordida]
MAARIYKFLDHNSYSSSTLIRIVESKYFTLIMLGVIVSNTIVMILETYDSYHQKYHSVFLLLEKIYLCIYTIECCFKLWVYSWRYFKILWNCFDLFLIIISIIDLITQELTYDNTQSSLQINHNQQIHTQLERLNHFLKVLRVLRVLRSFRALRVLRTIRFIQSIHTIVKTCFQALPAMASITFIMIIITCISAIIARSLFGDICPEKFNNLIKTFFSLFTLLTLDDWYSIYQVCAERDYANFQLIFCLIYIFIINFILLNLLMAVLVDSFQHTLDYDTKKDNQLKNENNIEECILNNLTQLTEEYCYNRKFNKEKDDISIDERIEQQNQSNNLSKDYQQKQSLLCIEKIMKKYYMLMESLEFRMERHEQLTKLAQKSIKLTLIDQENRKATMKR